MDSQVQNFNKLAELISVDVVARLRLNSGDTILKLVSKELSKLTDITTKLAKGISSLDTTLKVNSNISGKVAPKNTPSVEPPAPLAAVIDSPSTKGPKENDKEAPKKSIAESVIQKALDIVSAKPKEKEAQSESKAETKPQEKEVESPKKSFLEGSILKALDMVSARPKESLAAVPKENEAQSESKAETKPQEKVAEIPKKTITQGVLEKALDFVSARPKENAEESPKKSFLENSVQKALDLISKKPATISNESVPEKAQEGSLTPVSNKPEQIASPATINGKQSTPSEVSVESIKPVESAGSVLPEASLQNNSKTLLEDTLLKLSEVVSSNKPKEESSTRGETPPAGEEKEGLMQNLLDKVLVISKTIEKNKTNEPSSGAEGPKSELKAVEKPKEVVISGIGEQALKGFAFPSFLERFKDLSKLLQGVKDGVGKVGSNIKDLSNSKGGLLDSLFSNGPLKALLPVLGGAALVLGGIASLVAAFTTDSGIKGTLETVGKLGIRGGLTILAKNIAKLGSKLLKRIPVIGSLISFGFALQRFSNGDIIGGVLDVGSGIASLFPGVGTVISIGIDVLQAILDAKGGGSSKEASAKKGGILLEWAKSIGGFIEGKLKYIPIIGPLYETGKALMKGEWKKALIEFSSVIPGLQLVKMLMGEEKYNAIAGDTLTSLGNWFKGIGEFIDEKIKYLPVIGPLYHTGKALLKGEWKKALIEFSGVIPGLQVVKLLMGDEKYNAVAGETLTSLGNWFTGIGEFIDEKIKYLPVLGPLYYTGKSLLKGDFKKALFELTTLFPPLQFVRALMTEKEVTQASENLSVSVKDWFKGVGNFIDEKIKYLPVLGPLYHTGKALLKGNYKEALSEFINIIPGLSWVRSLLGDENIVAAAEGAVVSVKGWITSIQDWIYEKAANLPVIGPLIAAIENLITDPLGVLEILPGGKSLISLFKFATSGNVMETSSQVAGNIFGKAVDWITEKVQNLPIIGPLIKAVSSAINDPASLLEYLPGGKTIVELFSSGNITGGIFKIAGDVLGKVGDWVSEKVQNLPIIGPLIKIFSSAINDPIEFLKALPGGQAIIGFLEGAKNLASSAISTVGNFASSLSEKVKNLFSSMLDSILNGFLNLIPETVSIMGISIDIRSRVASLLGIKTAESSSPPASSPAPSSAAAPESSPVKQAQDSAIDPQGGLIVSSPTVGALYQINKRDGIVTGPVMDDNKNNIKSSGPQDQEGYMSSKISGLKNALFGKSDSNKSDSILERIANNTAVSNENITNLIAGFNNLAKALEKTLGESAGIPPVISTSNNNNQQQMQKPTSSQYANVGNSDISNFRTNFIEGARFRPA